MPTFIHGKNTDVLVGNADLTAYFKDANMATTIDTAETSAFGNTYKTFVQGLGASTIALTGMWATGSAADVDDVLSPLINSAAVLPVSVWPNGVGIGRKGFGMGSTEDSYGITASIGAVVGVTAGFKSVVDSGGKSGVGLFPGTGIVATASQTSVDQLAATTKGGYTLLHVPANTWNANAVIIVEDSADNSSWATIATFTTVPSTTTTSEYKAIAGNIRRYVRSTITLTAGAGSITPVVLLVRL